tara:strand:- start:4442 stop:5251 length:810 start_codon:yes stop_codon:yes gene_type:complete
MVAGWAHASIVATPTSLDVNFNDASDYPNNAVFRGFDVAELVHDATGGIAGDGALDITANSRGLNWKQALSGTTINQTAVFTKNDLTGAKGKAVFLMMGFSTDVDGHVTNPTQGAGSAGADAFQLQFYHDPLNSNISLSLKSFKDGANLKQKHSNMAYTGSNMLQVDLSLELTAADTFTWGATLTDLGSAGAGSTEVANFSDSFVFADFATALAGDGVYAGMRSANLSAGSLSGLDEWSVSSVIPEPASVGLIGAFGGSILFIRRRFMM